MNILQSILNNFVPIHREGYPFIGIFFVVALVLGFFWAPLFWLGLLLTVWCAYFFRDPARATPCDDNLVIAPADGKISFVGRQRPPQELGLGQDEMLRFSIFMNVFSVHINRLPVSGKIEHIHYQKGSFLNAELDKASENNERNSVVVASGHGKVGVVQIAGLVARRIICWPKIGDQLAVGQRYGLIRFGSRLDIYLPNTAKPLVGIGQTAIAGETILASFDGQVQAIDSFKLD